MGGEILPNKFHLISKSKVNKKEAHQHLKQSGM